MATKREDPIDDVNRVLKLCNVFRTVMDSLYIKVSISCYNKGSPGSPLMQFVFFSGRRELSRNASAAQLVSSTV